MRDADVPWLTALLDQPGRQAGEMGTALLKALPTADRDGWLAGHPDSPLFAAIELVPAPWSATLSAVARDRILAVTLNQHSQLGSQTRARRLLRVAAARLEPPVMPDLDPAQVPQVLADSWAKMMSTLQVRAAMRRELTENANTVEPTL